MKIIYLLTLIFSINALTFFWSDDENEFFKVKCNPTSPKSDSRDLYTIGSDRLPKRNGSEYVYSARDVADEVFRIVFAQGGNLSLAFGKCSQALVKVGNGSTKPCEKYLTTLQYNDGLQSNLRNNEKYKNPEFQDGFYEECEGDFVSKRYTLVDDGYYEGLREIFDDNTHFIQKKIFVENKKVVWEEDYFTYGLYRDGQKLLYGGPGEINEINNLRTRKNYKDGELHGAYEKYFPNGQLLYRLNYVEGIIEDGVYPIYKSDGTFTELVFKDGDIYEGLYRMPIDLDGFYGFATEYIIPYKDGKKVDGTYQESWMYKLSDGTGFEKKTFETYSIKDGNFHGERSIFYHTRINSETRPYKRVTNYKDGEKDGWDISWYSNGNKQSSQFYKDGEKDGWDISWYSNGNKQSSQFYILGARFGFETNYSIGGDITGKRECYINNVYSARGTGNAIQWGDDWFKCIDPEKNDGYVMMKVD